MALFIPDRFLLHHLRGLYFSPDGCPTILQRVFSPVSLGAAIVTGAFSYT